MEEARPVLPLKQALLVLLLTVAANGVQCFPEKKVLSFQEWQWKQEGYTSSCLSQKSSESYQKEKEKDFKNIYIGQSLNGHQVSFSFFFILFSILGSVIYYWFPFFARICNSFHALWETTIIGLSLYPFNFVRLKTECY